MEKRRVINAEISIAASTTRVWEVITSPQYAKTLGSELAPNAYLESDWELGAKVHFKYTTGNVLSTGKITKLIVKKLIQVDYNFDGFAYVEKYALGGSDYGSSLQIFSGPYGDDLDAQKVVWNNWLNKVKELGEE